MPQVRSPWHRPTWLPGSARIFYGSDTQQQQAALLAVQCGAQPLCTLAPWLLLCRRRACRRPLRPCALGKMTTITTSTTSSLSPSKTALRQQSKLSRSLRKSSSFGPSGIVTASTPNLNALYSSQTRLAPALSRKASLATLTQSSLASIPDVSESYALESVLNESTMAPLTPGKLAVDEFAVGDTVDVPGNMHGVVRFVGSVEGKKGVFAGVELHPDFASRGKNSGDVDGYANNICCGLPCYTTNTIPAYPISQLRYPAPASFCLSPRPLDGIPQQHQHLVA